MIRRNLYAMLMALLLIPLVGLSMLALVGNAARKPLERPPQPPTPIDTSYRRCEGPTALDSALKEVGVPFPWLFVRIAIVETGWSFREGVGRHNNLFGMQCSGRADSCVQGADGSYSAYPTRMAAVRDLKAWIDVQPYCCNAGWFIYMAHVRRWNPRMAYWLYVMGVPYPYEEPFIHP